MPKPMHIAGATCAYAVVPALLAVCFIRWISEKGYPESPVTAIYVYGVAVGLTVVLGLLAVRFICWLFEDGWTVVDILFKLLMTVGVLVALPLSLILVIFVPYGFAIFLLLWAIIRVRAKGIRV